MSAPLWRSGGRRAGVVAGDRVALAADRSWQTVVWVLAAMEAEVAYVPLDLAYPAERLRQMLAQAKVRLVMGTPAALKRLQAATGDFARLNTPASEAASGQPNPGMTYLLFTSSSTGQPKGVAMGSGPLQHLIDFHASHPRLGQAARTLQFAPLSFDVHFQKILSTVACGGTLVLLSEAQRRDPASHTRLQRSHPWPALKSAACGRSLGSSCS